MTAGSQGAIRRLIVKVGAVCQEAEDVLSYVLVEPTGSSLPAFSAGAHIDIFLPSGLVRQYSLANDPQETHRYVIGVQREARGRGGSNEMHDHVGVGDKLQITPPTNNFPLCDQARHHLLIAGGIGITPIVAMAQTLQRTQASWSLHYCTRSLQRTAFRELLSQPPYAGKTVFHHDGGDLSKGLDVPAVLTAAEVQGTHVYCCGPAGLMQAVRAAGAHWPSGSLHFEYFSANPSRSDSTVPTAEGAFEVELANSGDVFVVPPGTSILTVLEQHGVPVPSLCAEGICGTCLVEVLEGVPDHRDYVLTDAERAAGKLIAVCCSRAQTRRIKLAL